MFKMVAKRIKAEPIASIQANAIELDARKRRDETLFSTGSSFLIGISANISKLEVDGGPSKKN